MDIKVPKEFVDRANELTEAMQVSTTFEVLRMAIEEGLGDLERKRSRRVDEALKQATPLFKREQFTKALSLYQSAFKMLPGSVEAAYGISACLERLGEYERALEAYHACLGLDPDHPQATARIGVVFMSLRRFQEAVVAFDRAIPLKPEWRWLRLGRADSLRVLGLPQESFPDYEAVLAVEPDRFSALCGLAEAHNAIRNFDGALPFWERAAALRPEDTKVQAGLYLSRSWVGEDHFGGQLSPDRQLQRERDERCIQWDHRRRQITCDNPLCPSLFPDELQALQALQALRSKSA